MKIKTQIILYLALILTAVGCKKDTYAPPSSHLTGRLAYNGDSINVEYNQVAFNVFQPGFGKTGPISGTFDQAGRYALLLFDGNYRFTMSPGQGPFRWMEHADGSRDTVNFTMKGDQKMDIQVTPYYLVKNAVFAKVGDSLTGTFKAQQIITDVNAKGIDRVTLYISNTSFVSGTDNIAASKDLSGASITDPTNIKLSVKIPAIVPAQNYVYARIGLKVAGIQSLIFSPLQKISF